MPGNQIVVGTHMAIVAPTNEELFCVEGNDFTLMLTGKNFKVCHEHELLQ